MADTERGDFPGVKCSDCGCTGVIFKHYGPLVPDGEVGYFDHMCMMARDRDFRNGLPPRPLGQSAPRY